MEMLPEILGRESAESFSDQPISAQSLTRILEAGRLAPSAKNRQPWRMIAITEKSRLERIAESCYGERAPREAQNIIAVCTTNLDYRLPNGHLSWPFDLALCIDYMAFQATHEGIGSCIWTTFREEEIREILTVPYSMKVPFLLLLGYSAEKKKERKERMSQNRILSYEHW